LVSSTTAARFEGFYTLAASERGRLKEKRKHIVSVLSSSLSKNSRVPFSYKKKRFSERRFLLLLFRKDERKPPARAHVAAVLVSNVCLKNTRAENHERICNIISSPFVVVVLFFSNLFAVGKNLERKEGGDATTFCKNCARKKKRSLFKDANVLSNAHTNERIQ
jgi:hypothetical protein